MVEEGRAVLAGVPVAVVPVGVPVAVVVQVEDPVNNWSYRTFTKAFGIKTNN